MTPTAKVILTSLFLLLVLSPLVSLPICAYRYNKKHGTKEDRALFQQSKISIAIGMLYCLAIALGIFSKVLHELCFMVAFALMAGCPIEKYTDFSNVKSVKAVKRMGIFFRSAAILLFFGSGFEILYLYFPATFNFWRDNIFTQNIGTIGIIFASLIVVGSTTALFRSCKVYMHENS